MSTKPKKDLEQNLLQDGSPLESEQQQQQQQQQRLSQKELAEQSNPMDYSESQKVSESEIRRIRRKNHVCKPTDLVAVYGVFPADNDADPISFYATQEEAEHCVQLCLFLSNYEHYKLWCSYRELDPASESSIDQYMQTIDLSLPENNYKILEMHYRIPELVSIVRMFSLCPLIGMPSETPAEITYLTNFRDPSEELHPLELAAQEFQADVLASKFSDLSDPSNPSSSNNSSNLPQA